MSVEWVYIPTQAGLTTPEQWQARAGAYPGARTVATLIGGCADGHAYRWKATIVAPDNTVSVIDRTNSLDALKIEVEHALYQTGWR